MIKKLKNLFKVEKPDVVHSHYFSNNGIYLKQAYLEKVPVRISHCHQSNKDNLRFGKKLALMSSRRQVYKYSTLMFGCSDKAREFLYRDKGSVFYYPIDFKKGRCSFDRQNILEKYDLPNDRIYFSFIGRFVEQKNIPFLLDDLKIAVEKNSLISLLMVGAGTNEEQTYRMVSDLGLKDHVFIIPKKPDIEEFLFLSECMLLPSLFEGLSIVTLEAQAVGTDCIVSHAVPEEAQLGLVTFLPLDKNIIYLPAQFLYLSTIGASSFGSVDENVLELIVKSAVDLHD
jgi:glycosyltransferase involved in cell wall biosynthesis